jgi:putative ATPase
MTGSALYPEAQIVLAHAALHICRAPKSNSVCRGIGQAMAYVQTAPAIPVPLHLRDTHYPSAKTFHGYGGYVFPHDDARGWVEQEYASGIRRGQFYQSDSQGPNTFEGRADQFWADVPARSSRGIRKEVSTETRPEKARLMRVLTTGSGTAAGRLDHQY